MKPFRDEQELAGALRALAPAPRLAFAAELDERAAAGFPRRREAKGQAPLARLLSWLRDLPPRRLVLPVAASVFVAVAVATAVIAGSQPGSGLNAGSRSISDSGTATSGGTTSFDGRGYVDVRPSKLMKEALEAGGGAHPDVAHAVADEPGTAAHKAAESFTEASQPLSAVTVVGSPGAPHREIERAAEMVLGAAPVEVEADAAKVFAAVHTAKGIVLSSSTQAGNAAEPRAEFSLLIPSAKLGDALAAFSRIGEVRSRNENTADITKPVVGAKESLQDSEARIDGLLNELAATETEAERDAVEAKLRGERRTEAALRAQLSNLRRRADLSRVSLRIESNSGDGSGGAGSDGSWNAGDALGDAGHILGIAAGVAILALAVLALLALLALLAWLASRAWLRRTRNRALG